MASSAGVPAPTARPALAADSAIGATPAPPAARESATPSGMPPRSSGASARQSRSAARSAIGSRTIGRAKPRRVQMGSSEGRCVRNTRPTRTQKP
jgi:hypothetical protein